MPSGVVVLIGILYLIALGGLFLYGVNAWVMLAVHWWHRRRVPAVSPPPPPAEWPTVTVQLPLYNEQYVARRLLEAVGRLDYPADRLEIQVLDDSTDETTAILTETALRLRARGLRVVHVRRGTRAGFKAGALAAGLREARGEFVAIFDADFVPPPDFLRWTIPYFAEPRVAVVQTRWGHLNREFSLLTVAQSLGIDGHFAVEQSARCWGNLLLNFNGTAGVWRRAAIDDAGGWAHDTLTEDLDLSYRAQLRGWRILYRPELVCPAELPVLITGFKSQQRRWAKGSIQTALKLLPAVLRSDLGLWAKYQAAIHLTYYMIHPLMLTVILLTFPLARLPAVRFSPWVLVSVSVAVGVATFGPGTMLVYAQRVLDPRWWRHAWRLPTIMVIGVGVAWSTSLAVLGAFWGRDREFVRTPKFGIGPGGGHWRGKRYRDQRPWGGVVEIGLGLYCAWTTWLFWTNGHYGALPFVALYTMGFLTVGGLTILHAGGVGWVRVSLAGHGSRRLGRRASLPVALVAAVLGHAPALALEAPADPGGLIPAGDKVLVAAGERWWTQSPDPGNPVACATCHFDSKATRGWAASFPKVRPLPPPDRRVMTLLQANAAAVALHYRLSDPRSAATAITAYLTFLGCGVPVTPGVAAGQPVFPERMRMLARSVQRGEAGFAARCRTCHAPAVAAEALFGFPRTVDGHEESLESFLERHRPGRAPMAWDAPAMADLVAYLTAQLRGRPVEVRPTGRPERCTEETP